MTLSLGGRPWPVQIGAFVVLSALALAAFRTSYVRGIEADIAERRGRLDDRRAERAKLIQETRRLKDVEAGARMLEARLSGLKARLPERSAAGTLMQRVEALAEDTTLAVRRFIPQPARTLQFYTELPYKLQLDGTYQELADFFEELASLEPPIHIRDVTITATPQTAGAGSVTAECSLVTFAQKDLAAKVEADGPALVPPPVAPPMRGVRNPFVSPPSATADSAPVRSRGLRGVRIGEVVLKGILKDAHGFVAMLQTGDKRTFMVRSGEQLLDGVVTVVKPSAVTFSLDPGGTSAREIVRELRPANGGR